MTLKNGDMLEGVIFESNNDSNEYEIFFPDLFSTSSWSDDSVLEHVFSDYIYSRKIGEKLGESDHNWHSITENTGGLLCEKLRLSLSPYKESIKVKESQIRTILF